MTDTDDRSTTLVENLRNMAAAYPADIWPTPPKDRQAKDAAAAHVMRRLAVPWFTKAADEIEGLRAEVERLRAELLAFKSSNATNAQSVIDLVAEVARLQAIVSDLADCAPNQSVMTAGLRDRARRAVSPTPTEESGG